MLIRFLLLVLLAAAGTLPVVETAGAASCQSLQRQMMMFQGSREMRQYHRVRERMAAQGCGGGQGFARAWPEPRAANRAAPERRKADRPAPERRAAKRVEPARSRSEPAPRRNEPAPTSRPAPQTASVSPRENARPRRSAPRMSVAAGTYRTLCVRTCDGYYFPISFSTTRDHFAADQETCGNICPGAEARIYYHRRDGEGPESMVSLEGIAYAELPAAFSYRSALNPSCLCGQPKGEDARFSASLSGAAETGVAAVPPLPRARREPGQDPETLANQDGRFALRLVTRALVASVEPPDKDAIRKVGVDEPNPVLTSPVPNDLDTSLLWAGSPS